MGRRVGSADPRLCLHLCLHHHSRRTRLPGPDPRHSRRASAALFLRGVRAGLARRGPGLLPSREASESEQARGCIRNRLPGGRWRSVGGAALSGGREVVGPIVPSCGQRSAARGTAKAPHLLHDAAQRGAPQARALRSSSDPTLLARKVSRWRVVKRKRGGMDPRRSCVLGASQGGEESAEDEHGARGGRDCADPGVGDGSPTWERLRLSVARSAPWSLTLVYLLCRQPTPVWTTEDFRISSWVIISLMVKRSRQS